MGGFDDYALADGPAVGPTGAVSWARHKASGQAVAVTELDTAVVADQAFLGRLRATAAALAKVGHLNVVPIREVVEGDGRVWVVEDWVDGRELGEILGDGRLTAEQAVALTEGVLRGLAAVHGKGVVHGDVSTASVVVAADGVPRLVGFGFNGLGGEPAADDDDVLAAAVVLRDLLAGGARHPKLEAVVERATSTRPKDRPKNAAALLALVEKAARSDFGKGWEAKPSLAHRAAPVPVEATEELVGPARATLTTPLPPASDPMADELDELDDGDGADVIDEPTEPAESGSPDVDATATEELEPASAAAAADATIAFELTDSGLSGESDQPSADDAGPGGSTAARLTEAGDELAGEESSPRAEAESGAAADDSGPGGSAEPAAAGGATTNAGATAIASSAGTKASAPPTPATPRPRQSPPSKGTKSRGKKHRKAPTATAPAAKPHATATATATATPAAASAAAASAAAATPTADATAAPGPGATKSPTPGAKPAPARKRRERRPPSRSVVRALAGVIMILIGAGTAVAVDRNQSADEVNQTAGPFGPGAPFEPGSTPIGEVPTLAQIADSDITGAWNMRLAVFESTGFFGTQVGQTVEKIYTIKSDCSVTPCALKLTVTDPVGEFDLRRQAEEYVVAVSGPQDCIILSTGALQVPLAGVASVSVHLRPTSAIRTPRGDWAATGLSGSIVTTFDTSNPGCTQGSGVQRSTAVGTRQ